MDDKIFDQVNEVDLKKTMETSYIDYAMSVIASRALPDVRDGLKPVQRRVLYSMIELNNGPDKPHRKCARIVGDTMGKYHPHGDSSIYGALVNMAQDWSTRYPLVDGHGNFGSEDGDRAAAMRYTEARLSKISMEMLADINKNTVDFVPNFDETEKEPTVLPARFPNLLVNGTTGIAVGMATNIPPHNLGETIDGVLKIIDNSINESRETTVEELMTVIKGPDFPTGAEILGRSGIEAVYKTGRGKIKVRSVTAIETMPNGKNRIVVTELPFLVNKARLIEKIAELAKLKKIDGITDLRDESNREGVRIVIELRKDVNPSVILKRLLRHTQLQDSFSVNMLALVNNEPRILNLLDMLKFYLQHQEDVVTRRTKYELNRAEERAHILEGLLIALEHIDAVIRMIREAENVTAAKTALCETYGLSDAQAQAIVDMRLRALTGLERGKIEEEYRELEIKIGELKSILSDEKKLLGLIRDELVLIKEKYTDPRRTKIGFDDETSDEELIPDETAVIATTKLGYIKRMSPDNFKAQNRGGKGIKGMQTIESDYIDDLLLTNTHHYILLFTNLGRMYQRKIYEIPEAGRTARGTALVNLIPLAPGEKVTAMIAGSGDMKDKYLFFATKDGTVKRTAFDEFANIRKNGLIAIGLREGDELIEVKVTRGENTVFMITKKGQCISFKETDVRAMGRSAAGVKGIELDEDDEVVGMQLDVQGETLLTVSENGMGKRTNITEFPLQKRGGKGVRCYKVTDKSGYVVGVKSVNANQELMIITTEGIVIRIKINDISIIGRNTSGVKLMDIDPASGVKVASIAKVREDDCEKVIDEEGLIEEEKSRLLEEDESLDDLDEEEENTLDQFDERND
ncbi:MAG: DNA gyrase subunit A [Lachnospiraceae bacterium]